MIGRSAWVTVALAMSISTSALAGRWMTGDLGIPAIPSDAVERMGMTQKLGDQVPLDAAFTDATGKAVTFGEVLSPRPSILVLVYHDCPMLCSMVLTGLVGALKPLSLEVGKDFDVIALSIDPKDTPETASKKKASAIKHYGRSDAGWQFLTGSKENIDRVASAIGFRYEFDASTGQYGHAGALTLLTHEGKVSRYFYGTEFPSRDVQLGLVEASDGKIGTFTDAMTLLCYQYDPLSGGYSASIMKIMRLGAVFTVLGLSGFMATSLIREKRRRRALMVGVEHLGKAA